jgi:poly(hydroxyalkanoate) depolymerase family esterase
MPVAPMRRSHILLLALLLGGCGQSDTTGVESRALSESSFERYSYTNDAGTRTYKVYVPAGLPPGKPAPLIVELHGCGGNADEEARWSRFNTLAAQRGLIVAYPEQDPNANGSRCWNWFRPEHQARDAGEPSLIAGLTHEVQQRWRIDARRTYVGGISAGGAMSVIMAATHPDLYAAAMVSAGCEYNGLPCLGSVSALPPETAGEMAYRASGPHARVVPVLVIQGDADPLVPYPNAEIVVQQFLATDDWADDGANDGSIPRSAAETTTGAVPGGHSYSIDTYLDASQCVLAQRWLINGLGHQWSAGESNGSPRDQLFTDPLGPDVTAAAVDFFLSHPLPNAGTQCAQAPR